MFNQGYIRSLSSIFLTFLDSIQDSFNLEAVLNGDADSFRIHRRRTAWMNSEPSFEEEDYADNYDFESLERRKR